MTASPWLGAHDAARALGISYSTLYRWRTAGLFKAGTHWRRKFPNTNSPVLYHLDRCNQAMSEATATSLDSIEPALLMPVI
ncbi:MAG: helix-turn-helix domain-containing protein [Prochlorococcaceae cyanobacterium]